MTLRSLAGTSALVLVMSASVLLADVTPEEVWQGWRDAATATGNTLSADSTKRDGDTLVLTHVMILMNDEVGSNAAIDTLSLKDNGDGTVGVIVPDTFPVTVIIPAKGSDTGQTDIYVNVTMPGAKITASGAPKAINYKTDAPEVTVALDHVEPADGSTVDAKAEAKLTGITSNYTVTEGDLQSFAENFSMKTAKITAKGSDPKTGSDFDMTATLADLTSSVAIKAPKDVGMADLTTTLAKGLTMTGSFGFGATSFDINANDAGKPTQIVGGIASGALGMALDAARFDYSTDTKGVTFKVASPDIPLADASLSWAEAGFHLLMPVAKSDKPADFSFLVTLKEVALAEDLWALMDPTKGLKHDPATIILDTKGQATMTQDILADAAQVGAGASTPPGLLNALDVTNLNIKAVGAEVTAKGGFTFDNSDMTTFNGVPAPTGKIEITATGINALIDTLVKMGLVPQDQSMQYRMMLSMFANTSATADEMTSTLEFKDKHFFANGQQLQ